jgi:hypothetical protein
MVAYTAYIIGADGQRIRSFQLLCSDDKRAKEYAEQFVDGCDIELWNGERQLVRLQSRRALEGTALI